MTIVALHSYVYTMFIHVTFRNSLQHKEFKETQSTPLEMERNMYACPLVPSLQQGTPHCSNVSALLQIHMDTVHTLRVYTKSGGCIQCVSLQRGFADILEGLGVCCLEVDRGGHPRLQCLRPAQCA